MKGRHPLRAFITTLAATAMLACVAGCDQPEESASLVWAGAGHDTSGFGVGIPIPKADQPVSVGSIVLCRTGNGPDPTITNVAFVEDGNSVKVPEFASRTRSQGEMMLGSVLGGLKEAGFSDPSNSVTTACGGEGGSVTELGITAQSSARAKAIAKTLRVTYTSGTRSAATDIPLSLVLCVSKASTEPCRP